MKLTLQKQMILSYKFLSECNKRRLESKHDRYEHVGWPAKECIKCRRELREEGVNIPVYYRGLWHDSFTPQKRAVTTARRLIAKLCGIKS